MTRRRAVLVALAVLALGAMATAWPLYSWWEDSREFRALTPSQHYARAFEVFVARSGRERITARDVKVAIHHLEAIPAGTEFRGHAWTAEEMVPLLRLLRDRPQDFPVAADAMFWSCMARLEAAQEEEDQKPPCRGFVDPKTGKCVIRGRCGFGFVEECAPLRPVWPPSLRSTLNKPSP